MKGKKCFTTKAKARSFLKKNISKRSRKSSRRKSSFGSWWNNTQTTYCRPGSECANASTLGGQYPFYNNNSDNWKPYYPVKGSAFGIDDDNEDDKVDSYKNFLYDFKKQMKDEPIRNSDGSYKAGACGLKFE